MAFDTSPPPEEKPSSVSVPPVSAGPPRNPWAPPPIETGRVAMIQHPWAGNDRMFPIALSPGRVTEKNQVSEFRTGMLSVGENGITISGKAVLPNLVRTGIYLVALILSFTPMRAIWLITYLVVEFALRRDRTEILRWSDVEGIAYDLQRGRLCVSFFLPGKPKTSYAIGIRLDAFSIEEFLRQANHYAPGIVRETKILPPTPKWVWAIVCVVILGLIGGIIWIGNKP